MPLEMTRFRHGISEEENKYIHIYKYVCLEPKGRAQNQWAAERKMEKRWRT